MPELHWVCSGLHEKMEKTLKVIATETRPVMQGSRLTAFELMHDDFDVRLISDTAVGYVMVNKMVDKVIVGADRILQ